MRDLRTPAGLLSDTLAAIDDRNAEDPRSLGSPFDGPMAQVQGREASRWLGLLQPDASPELQIAVRAHHIDRWRLARSEFPPGRGGYLSWRREQKQRQASAAGVVMSELGWSQESIAEVQRLLLRRNLASDLDSQRVEDCACLVFLESQFSDFSDGADPTRVVAIVAKTWNKMSPAAQRLAGDIPVAASSVALLTAGIEAARTGSFHP